MGMSLGARERVLRELPGGDRAGDGGVTFHTSPTHFIVSGEKYREEILVGGCGQVSYRRPVLVTL